MYTTRDFESKKEVKEAIAAGETVTVYQPGPFGTGLIQEGSVVLEGPHYPRPHRWYATGMVKGGKLVSIK